MDTSKNRKPKTKYDLTLLQTLMKNNEIIIYTIPDTIGSTTQISFQCKCGQSTIKQLIYIKKYGASCNECGKRICNERRKNTFLKNWGVECILQSNVIKEQIKKTNIDKYGAECVLQNKDILEKRRHTYIKNYGVDNPNKCKEVIEKTKATNLSRYGVINPNQLEEVKEKTKATNLERYGVNCVLQTPGVREKVKETCLERYGVEYAIASPDIILKANEQKVMRYGSEHLFKTEYFKNKRKDTMMEKYGVEHALQSPELAEKQLHTSYTLKDYALPSGRIIKIQGFEHYALDELVILYNEDNIIFGKQEVPRIEYYNNDKLHYYFPDFYVKSLNKIIEVKSEWTYYQDVERVHLKGQACIDKGYDFELWVYDKFGVKINNIPIL